jgi:hypothetical protein
MTLHWSARFQRDHDHERAGNARVHMSMTRVLSVILSVAKDLMPIASGGSCEAA